MTGELEAFSVVVKDVDHSLVRMCLLLGYVSESFGVLKCIKGIREVWTESKEPLRRILDGKLVVVTRELILYILCDVSVDQSRPVLKDVLESLHRRMRDVCEKEVWKCLK